MIIHVKTPESNLRIPALAVAVARIIPESSFEALRKKAPPDFQELISRKTFLTLYRACANELSMYKGLEIIRVENSYARRYNHIKGILMDYFSRVH